MIAKNASEKIKTFIEAVDIKSECFARLTLCRLFQGGEYEEEQLRRVVPLSHCCHQAPFNGDLYCCEE